LSDGANVYLTLAELPYVGAILGKLPTPAEHMEFAKNLDSMSSDVYCYLNFDQIASFHANAEEGKKISAIEVIAVSL